MSKTYLPYDPDQQLLLPAALQEWLPEDHLAYFISDVADQLGLSSDHRRVARRERRGGPPYHPRIMVKVLLYGYCVGVSSSKSALPSGSTRTSPSGCWRPTTPPTFRTISDFRKDHLACVVGIVSTGAGVVPAGGDGKAGLCGAGRHQGEGQRIEAQGDELYRRMKDEREAQLAAEVAELLRRAQEVDDEEDRPAVRQGKAR